jgi:hypothetical chaperone protein
MYAGFDYGTSNCSIGLIHRGSVRLVPLEGSALHVPSMLYAPRPAFSLSRLSDPDNNSIDQLDVSSLDFAALRFGHEALAAYQEDPAEGYFIKSPKSFLGAPGLSEEMKTRLILVVAAMMANIKRHADAAAGGPISHVVIGRPVNFQGTSTHEANQQALSMLVAAAREAGFEYVTFLYEPLAAAMEYESRLTAECCVLVVDIGGGTTDCSFVRVGPRNRLREDRSADILGHAGERLGGNDYDQMLALRALMPPFGFGDQLRSGLPVPNVYFADCVCINDVNAQQRFYGRRMAEQLARCHRDAEQPEHIARLQTVHRQRLSYRLARSAELGKIALSEADAAPVDLGYVEPGLKVVVSREQFAQSCERLLGHLRALIDETIGLGGREPDLLYLTGGMARSPLVRQYLADAFPRLRLEDSDHLVSVTQGLTLHAQRVFGAQRVTERQ